MAEAIVCREEGTDDTGATVNQTNERKVSTVGVNRTKGIRTEEEQIVYDQILKYLFTMKLEELEEVRDFIESQNSGRDEFEQ